MEIKISAKLFAEFVVGSPAKKQSAVRNILKPRSPEAQIPTGYYRRAIGIIREYHDRNNDSLYLSEAIKSLQKQAISADTKQARTKHLNNLTAIESYMRSFSTRQWRVTSCPRIHHSSSGIRISGVPDLALQDGNRLKLVKLGIRKEKETAEMIRLMLRVIYQASKNPKNKTRLNLNERDVAYFDIVSGEPIVGAPADLELADQIETGCRLLRDMIQRQSGENSA